MINLRIKQNIKRFFRNKINYLIVILIGICCAFSIIVNSLTYSGKQYYKDNVLNWVDFRTYVVVTPNDSERLIKKLNSMEEVIGVFDNYGYYSYWEIEELNNYFPNQGVGVWISGIADSIKAVEGNDLPLSDEDSIVCPISYYPLKELNVEGKDNKFDLSPFIGKNITLVSLEDKTKKFNVKLVGLYDNDKLQNNYQDCYTNYKTLEKIKKNVKIYKDKLNIYFEIKDKTDEDKVISELKKAGFWPESVMVLDQALAIDSFETMDYISYGLFAIFMLIVLCLAFYNMLKNKNVIKMNKILGYSNKKLIFTSFIEISCLFITSFISISMLLIIMLLIFRKFMPIYYPSFKYIKVLISPHEFIKMLLILICILLFILIINFIFLLKNNTKIKYKKIETKKVFLKVGDNYEKNI